MRTNWLKYLVLVIVLSLGVSLVALAQGPAPTPAQSADDAFQNFLPYVPSPNSLDPGLTIAGIAASNPDFSTLVAALTAAELVEPLNSPGAYTVFAPTNAAFEALPEGALEALLADPDALAAVLLYHVADGVFDAGQVVERDYITTLQGQDIEIEVTEDGVVLNGEAMVVVTNLFATNGVVHVIDAVLLPPELPTIAAIAAADENFSTLVTALGVAGLVETLDSPGTFTVFAPTNDAFAALPESLLQAILADTDTLTAVLTYHAAGEKLRSDQVVARDAITTLNGQDITVEVTEDGVVLNGTALVTAVDILASNGVIHVIDAVLIPPEPTIATLVAGAEAFSTLATALEVTGLDAALAGPGPFTVFAPTNDAFDALPEGVLDDLLANPEALTEVLLYHVVGGIAVASDVVGLDYITTLQGQDIEIEVTESGVVLNGAANVIGVDVLATNGVVHVIDAVLLPPELPTIVEIAASDENFSTLVAALTAADLVDDLAGPGPFTVFAPTNDAFDALPEGVLDDLLADVDALTDVLLYHVAGEKLRSDKVVASETIMMLNGDEVMVEVTEAGVVLNGAVMITAVDILASNGVIHVIDAVLLPPAELQTIAEIASADENFSILAMALAAAGLDDTLNLPGNYTVFAPVNVAFDDLPEGLLEALLADPQGLLRQILLYHVVDGIYKAADIVELDSLTTLQGSDITIEVVDGVVVLNGEVNVVITNIMASNGVIHVIDGVLIPPQD